MSIPALTPVVSPLLELLVVVVVVEEEEEVAVGLAAEELTVTDAMDVEVVNDDEADAVVFGFCWVTVRLARMKYP
jgi:hypothetical protein